MQKEQKDKDIKAFEKEIREYQKMLADERAKIEPLNQKIREHEQTEKDMSATILAYDDLIKAYRAVIIDMGRAIDHKCKQPFFDDRVFVIREGRRFYLR